MVNHASGKLPLDGDQILVCGLEQLAFYILQNYSHSSEWHLGNWMKSAAGHYRNQEVELKLSESISWLEARGMLVLTPSADNALARSVSQSGDEAIEREDFSKTISGELLSINLHRLLNRSVDLFHSGDFETAIFKAFKEVEVRIRELGNLPHKLVGVALAREAFNKDRGCLTDMQVEPGERQARSDLFAGALGSFKNPVSHRTVVYTDPYAAASSIMLADLLMRILDETESSRRRSTHAGG